ncbi:regulatory helix-turn-helix protein, AraC family [Pedobacter westerhofensis]|uniref:Regulatory helix-turn-helix protein, AraC family n=1 Tax=Pedobacter westerhofensis TaxID=425512 RepID=A0A521FK69_9SPHI|nr:regulatory helix-turn-helix protein, AraC family [Pedobacter westerhofensis]
MPVRRCRSIYIKYKVKIIETRLLSSDMRINEMVDEFKFSDESHLNRVFKKYKGMSPSSFRKNELAKFLV